MNISTILVDDEHLAIAELTAMLQAFPDLVITGTALDGKEAIKKIETLKPQLIFLDINMPGMTGFELIEQLDDVPEVIFITAYDEFALRAFEVSALDYILKPVNPRRLEEAVAKVKNKINGIRTTGRDLTMDKRIFIKDGDECHFVPVHEIHLLESVGNYVRVCYRDKKPLLHKSLNYIEEKFPPDYFFRANRQQIINVNFIKTIVPYFNSTLQAELESGVKIDISQRQSVRFRDLMGI